MRRGLETAMEVRVGGSSLAGLAVLAMVRAADASVLTVEVEGFADTVGQAVLRLHDSSESDLEAPARLILKSLVRDGRAIFVANGLVPGRYALVAFHDRNGNGVVDHGWTGFPVEPLAFSNGFRPGVQAGMPTHSKVAIPIALSAESIRLRLAMVDASTFFRRSAE